MLFALWSLEWVFSWSSALGWVAAPLQLAWWVGLAYFVVATRRLRAPGWLRTWLWLAAALAVTVARAVWIGEAGLSLFSALFDTPETRALGEHLLAHEGVRAFDAVFTSMFLGLLVGFYGACEAVFIAIAGGLTALLDGSRRAARVGWVKRAAVVLVQGPMVFLLLFAGLSAIAGALGAWVHPESTAAGARPIAQLPGQVAAIGVGLWALALAQLRWFAVLARGRVGARLCLGALGLAVTATLVYLTGPDARGVALGLVWLIVQVGALAWARPRPAAASEELSKRTG